MRCARTPLGDPAGQLLRAGPRPRGLPGRGGHTRGGAASAQAAGAGPLPPPMTGSERAECRRPHPHLTSKTAGFPRAHTGHTQKTPELGIPQRASPNPQEPEVLVTPPPAESGPRVRELLGRARGAVAGSGRAEPRACSPSVPGLTLAWGLEDVRRPASQSRDRSPGQQFCQPLCFHQRWRPIKAAFGPGKLEGGKREPHARTLW